MDTTDPLLDERPVAVVTGAGSGIGAACAAALDAAGMAVLCADRDGAAAESVAAGLGCAVGLAVDVRSADACERMAEAAVQRWGRIDAAVTAAGIGGGRPAHETDDDEFGEMIAVNLTGTFFSARAVARRMIALGRPGAIVLIGSITSHTAVPGRAAYCASKGGVETLGKALALDWAPSDIRVNVVAPGYTETGMSAGVFADPAARARYVAGIPLGDLAQPEQIASVAAFLLGPAASYMTGAYVPADGGWLALGGRVSH